MLSVRIRGHNYRISNETLDRVLGEGWRQSNEGFLRKRLEDLLDSGALIARGHRLHRATRLEHAEQQLRMAERQEEIFRWGLLYVGLQIEDAATGVWAVGELAFDESVATTKLSRDPTPERQ
jgi:hypothetical protein